MTPLLRRLIDTLDDQERATWHEYTVPGLWVGSHTNVTFPCAASYFLHQLRRMDGWRSRRETNSPWSISSARAYNTMVRQATSFDHGPGTEQDGWRHTGTFLKLMALLPYLRSLGVDTLILLPITEIGSVGRKGALGSPYAVRHPFRLDPLLAEPGLEMSVDDQARVLFETCHLLGMKVILETVLRTASIDSDLVGTHPEWFYWVDEEALEGDVSGFTSPIFTATQLREMKMLVNNGTLVGLPVPSTEYQMLFDHMPLRVVRDSKGWKGIGARGKVLRIPGAFADWPPDDPQPAWSDVTYLRMHDHPSYRYMAYNTIRMYEEELDQPSYRQSSLWNTVSSIIPHYIRMFGIDGAMIDMGHALPAELRSRIVSECRALKSDFLLLEENFHLSESSSTAGYNAVIGYLPFDAYNPAKLRSFIHRLQTEGVPVRYFATPESHNTPRVAMRMSGRTGLAVWLGLQLLPRGFGFLHAGAELLEHRPVNTGLGFSSEEIRSLQPNMLALFDDVPLPWKSGNETSNWLKEKQETIRELDVVKHLMDDDWVQLIAETDSDVVAYVRFSSKTQRGILVVINYTDVARTIRIMRHQLKYVRFVGTGRGVHQRPEEIMIDLRGSDCVVVAVLVGITSV